MGCVVFDILIKIFTGRAHSNIMISVESQVSLPVEVTYFNGECSVLRGLARFGILSVDSFVPEFPHVEV
jgi:hypothetical protein